MINWQAFAWLRPRWAKALADVVGNRVRLLLVVASIAVGLFAVGMIATMHYMLSEDMTASYEQVNPANIYLYTTPFETKFVDSVRRMPEVKDAQAERTFSVRLRSGKDEWTRINVKAVADMESMSINRVRVLEGKWPPGDKEIVFDRHKLESAHIAVGDMVEVRLADDTLREMKCVGVVQDQTIGAVGAGGYFLADLQAYVSDDTLQWLGQTPGWNVLLVTAAENAYDEAYLHVLAEKIVDRVERNDHLVMNRVVRRRDDHPNMVYVEAMSGTLFALGFLVVFLSAFLITNTLMALLNQQVEQIGVMKTVGAKRRQVISVYMVLILTFSLLGLMISLAFSGRAAYRLLEFLSKDLNIIPQGYRREPGAILLQVLIALVVPQLAGAFPVLRAAMLSVQEAFNGAWLLKSSDEVKWLDFFITRLHLPRPLLISLRNTFRRKGRLALTLITLAMGGAMFIATFNVRSSMQTLIHTLSRYFIADVNLTMERPYRLEDISRVLTTIPEVGQFEAWAGARAEILDENGEPGETVNLMAPPAESALIEPVMLKGRWLLPGDQNAIVLSELFLSNFPDIEVGDTIRLRVNGKDTTWVVVGFFQFAGKAARYVAYADYTYLSQLTHQVGKSYSYRIIAARPLKTIEEQKQLGQILETVLNRYGYQVNDISPGLWLLQSATTGLDMLVIFLLIMAALAALVGSIGLTGTLSMNVLERTREIAVMRAIGASDRIVMQLVIVEGVLIGMIGWFLGCLVAFPISQGLWVVISTALFGVSAEFTVDATGFVLWIFVVLILSLLASILPARNAARMTIREALAYE
ncbi:MAG: ABC transporter permease [Anaerolineae bacterium]|nr:ABC transporter permease [Anaerolineae bacterium]